ncbi:MAG TPA: pitrilysin family protein, partial [Chroococcales cyanobacterium]
KAHFKYLEAAGASSINGTTDFDRTNYFETLPANQLELGLWLESDRMGYLADTLDREKLENQRDVVRNERRQSIENQPYGLVEEALFHGLFPKEHPYYASVIGSHADIEAARLKDVRNFFKQYYTPNNASLAIVGDFDKEKVKALVEKYFGTIPAGPPVPAITVKTPPITARRTVTVTDQVELPRLYMAWLTPVLFKPGDAEADVTAHILGGSKSSRLYKKLVYERQIAQDVSVSNQNLMLGSVFTIQVTAKPGVKLEDLEKAVNEEVAAMRTAGPTAQEVEGARNVIETHIIGGLENLGGFGGVADRLNMYNFFLNNPGYLPEDVARYNKVSVQDVQKFARDYLTDGSAVVVNGVPGKKVIDDVARQKEEAEKDATAIATAAEEDWRKSPPVPASAVKMSLPVPATFKLDNGLSVYVVEQHNLPVVAAHLVALAGSTANPIAKPGLASFTTDMLDEGTTKRPALKIASDLDQLGASLHTGCSQDGAFAAIYSLTKNVDPTFEILSDVCLDPAFDQKEIDRVRDHRITSLKQDKDRPTVVANQILYRKLYSPENPLHYDERGTIESNQKMSRDDMEKFWKQEFVPNNTALVIAGDVTTEQAKTIANKYFGNWKGSVAQNSLPEPKGAPERAVFIVNKDAAPQTALRLGTLGISHSNPDYVPARVFNTAFGGMFSSRLNMNLREKHGYTYGAHSGFNCLREVGPFSAAASVRTDVTGPAVTEFFNEIKGVESKPITPEELKMSKDSMVLSLPAMFETTSSVAGTTSDLFVFNLPNDYYRNLPTKINATTT